LPPDDQPRFRTRRRFDYARRLLPSEYLARLEPEGIEDPRIAVRLFTGATIGYPAWNLLYYALFCSLPGPDPDPPSLLPNPLPDDVVVIETGTSLGASTIVMAQALEDAGLDAPVHTVDINSKRVEDAKRHVGLAGHGDRVRFNVEDSLTFLSRLVEQQPRIDFAFLDSDHHAAYVEEEFSIIHPAVVASGGTVYFDNTSQGGVAGALENITAKYGGNLVRFDNCSWRPQGNAIWQPDRTKAG
jgi:Methyltransferase domain